MSSHANFGDIAVEGIYEEMQVEWKITNFSVIAKNELFKYCESPFFTFGNVSWFLQLWPKSSIQAEDISLYLLCTSYRNYTVKYNLGVKRMGNSVEQLVTGNLKGDFKCTNRYYKNRSEILQRKSELLQSDVLIITCTLKRGTILSSELETSDNPKAKKFKKLETLSENFKSLSHNKESCDITLHVMDKEYKAHKAVLIARSSVFAAMFQHETLEKQTGIVTIPDCDPESFKIFLEFLYSGKLEELTPSKAPHLYETSEKYNIQELKTFCSEYLMENLTVENLCDVVITADKFDDTNLLAAVQMFFNNNLNKVLMTSEWRYFLKNNLCLANKLLVEMSTKMKAVD